METKRIRLIDFDENKHRIIYYYYTNRGNVMDSPVKLEDIKNNSAPTLTLKSTIKFVKENPNRRLNFNFSSGRSGWIKNKNIFVDVEEILTARNC